MKHTNWVLGGFALLVALAVFAPGQVRAQAYASGASTANAYDASMPGDSDDPQSPILTIRKRVDEVNVLFIATDKRGKFVRDLNQNDFTILDDHKPPQAIVNFRRETDLPLDLGLLIDASGSVNSRFEFEQDAATSFLQRSIRPRFDKAFVLGFNSHTQLVQDF